MSKFLGAIQATGESFLQESEQHLLLWLHSDVPPGPAIDSTASDQPPLQRVNCQLYLFPGGGGL